MPAAPDRPDAGTAWLDHARVVAILAVVVLHVAAGVVIDNPVGSPAWWAGNAWDAAMRWCVPVFVMISGALLLDPARTEPLAVFYRKRLSRVLLPLLAWSALYLGRDLWRAHAAGEPLPWAGAWQAFQGGAPHYHLWFLFMIVPLYAVTPFLRMVTARASRSELLVLVAFSGGLAMAQEARAFDDGPGSPLNWFLSYVPYFLGGWWLRGLQRRPPLAGLAAVVVATVAATAAGCYLRAREAGLEQGLYFYYYLSVTVVPMSVAVMLGLRRWPAAAGGLPGRFAGLTLGVYLLHPLLLETLLAQGWGPQAGDLPWLGIPLLAVVVAGASLGLAWGISRVPGLRRLI